jgi:peptidoglycan-N-acetylglucosamine deacetylase
MKKWFILLTAVVLLTGCSAQTDSNSSSAAAGKHTKADDQTSIVTAARPAPVIANDSLTNLQLDNPAVPVYDHHTYDERRQAGLPTQLPPLTPYTAKKIVYLTFDDGPDDKNTAAVLDILQQNQITATFFLVGRYAKLYPKIVHRIYDEGHAIGNHSYDHDYQRLYKTPDSYLAEMRKTDAILYDILGVRPLITRAPGGTVGNFTKAYWNALKISGYTEYDWNVSSADAAPHHPVAQDFIDNVEAQIDKPAVRDSAIILMHCSSGHEETVKALPRIIQLLKERGYTFGVITPMTPQPW